MKVKFIFFLTLFLVQTGLSQIVNYPTDWDDLHHNSGWTIVTQKERLCVYKKKLKVSPVPAIKVELNTRANPSDLMEIIWAVDKYPVNLPSAHSTDAGFIERFDSNHQLAWQVIDIPFLSPRMYQFNHQRNLNKIDWVKSTNKHIIQNYKDLIVPAVNFGSWEVKTSEEETTLIYRACTDPAGSVPSWLVDRVSMWYIPQMLLDLENTALQVDK
ncbi:MAG: hypothetical protein H8E82_06425 [Candidatus Marinimicrobia bacterium]|nr:hypothetical protein [Candidatus Neomarinimicrobiota bacterium]